SNNIHQETLLQYNEIEKRLLVSRRLACDLKLFKSNCSIKTYRFIAGSVIKTSHLFLRKAVNVIVVANV
uniref:hypothetical protein n=1 Tax=Vibrio cholerae TaxID=666 RepID=UPI001C3CFB52